MDYTCGVCGTSVGWDANAPCPNCLRPEVFGGRTPRTSNQRVSDAELAERIEGILSLCQNDESRLPNFMRGTLSMHRELQERRASETAAEPAHPPLPAHPFCDHKGPSYGGVTTAGQSWQVCAKCGWQQWDTRIASQSKTNERLP